MNQQAVFDALEKPSAYPHDARRPVSFKETHISRVYLTGKFAYKVKKAVVMPFLDYSTLEKRREFCEKELALNKPLAGKMYLSAVPIVEDGGIRVLDEKQAKKSQAPVVEWALKMIEFPQASMLNAKLKRGDRDAGEDLFKNIARKLAKFHDSQGTSQEISAYGLPEKITERWNNDFRVASQHRRLNQAFVSRVHNFVEANRALLEERVKKKRSRDGHGDVHTGNVFVPKRGEFYLFDRIEFRDDFRWGDVARDVGFMAMDLDHLKRPDLREVFVKEYARASGDKTIERVLLFYQAYYAHVRAFVADIRAGQETDRDEAVKARKVADSYYRLAESYEF